MGSVPLSKHKYFQIVPFSLIGARILELVDPTHNARWSRSISAGKFLKSHPARFELKVTRPGFSPDISFSLLGEILVSADVAQFLSQEVPDDIQLVPAQIVDSNEKLYALNATRRIACLASYEKLELTLNADRIGRPEIFRLSEMPFFVIVSARLKEALEANFESFRFLECKVIEGTR